MFDEKIVQCKHGREFCVECHSKASRSDELLSFDVNGYPTQDCLGNIRKYRGSWGDFLGALSAAFAGYGKCERRDDGVWEVSTGGWSGNEDIIDAMQSNYVFWGVCWLSSRRGGHYEFKT